jgi:hypothetical protein
VCVCVRACERERERSVKQILRHLINRSICMHSFDQYPALGLIMGCPTCTGILLCVLGSTWTANHCSKDRYLDAGGSVTAICNTCGKYVNKRATNCWTKACVHMRKRACVREREINTILYAVSLPLSVCQCVLPYDCEKFTSYFCHPHHCQQQWRHCDAHGSPECTFAECYGHMVNIPTAYLGGPLPRDQLSWAIFYFFTVLPCSHNAIEIRPWILSSLSFMIYYSLVTLFCDTEKCWDNWKYCYINKK